MTLKNNRIFKFYLRYVEYIAPAEYISLKFANVYTELSIASWSKYTLNKMMPKFNPQVIKMENVFF